MQLAGYAATFFILDLQEPRGKLAHDFRLPDEFVVFHLEFAAALPVVWQSMEVPGPEGGLMRIEVPSVVDPEGAKYVQATVQGSVGGVALDAHQAQANGTPAVWQVGGVPSPATITVTAVDAQGRSGQASSSI